MMLIPTIELISGSMLLFSSFRTLNQAIRIKSVLQKLRVRRLWVAEGVVAATVGTAILAMGLLHGKWPVAVPYAMISVVALGLLVTIFHMGSADTNQRINAIMQAAIDDPRNPVDEKGPIIGTYVNEGYHLVSLFPKYARPDETLVAIMRTRSNEPNITHVVATSQRIVAYNHLISSGDGFIIDIAARDILKGSVTQVGETYARIEVGLRHDQKIELGRMTPDHAVNMLKSIFELSQLRTEPKESIWRFNSPTEWDPKPERWLPPSGWKLNPTWPPCAKGWTICEFGLEENGDDRTKLIRNQIRPEEFSKRAEGCPEEIPAFGIGQAASRIHMSRPFDDSPIKRQSQGFGLILRIIGWNAQCAGMLLILCTAPLSVRWQEHLMSSDPYIWFMVVTASLIGIEVYDFGRKVDRSGRRNLSIAVKSAEKLRNRSPVLYLRSFGDDPKLLNMDETHRMRDLWRQFLPMNLNLPIYSRLTQEEQMVRGLRPLGPVVSIGRPSDPLPILGAIRIYPPPEKWQELVLDLIGSSRIVVLSLASSKGLLWELAQVVRLVPPSQIAILVFMDRVSYKSLATKVNSEVGEIILSPADGRKIPLGSILPPYPFNAGCSMDGQQSPGFLVRFAPDWTPQVLTFDAFPAIVGRGGKTFRRYAETVVSFTLDATIQPELRETRTTAKLWLSYIRARSFGILIMLPWAVLLLDRWQGLLLLASIYLIGLSSVIVSAFRERGEKRRLESEL